MDAQVLQQASLFKERVAQLVARPAPRDRRKASPLESFVPDERGFTGQVLSLLTAWLERTSRELTLDERAEAAFTACM